MEVNKNMRTMMPSHKILKRRNDQNMISCMLVNKRKKQLQEQKLKLDNSKFIPLILDQRGLPYEPHIKQSRTTQNKLITD